MLGVCGKSVTLMTRLDWWAVGFMGRLPSYCAGSERYVGRVG
jgi:hypothetical protein